MSRQRIGLPVDFSFFSGELLNCGVRRNFERAVAMVDRLSDVDRFHAR